MVFTRSLSVLNFVFRLLFNSSTSPFLFQMLEGSLILQEGSVVHTSVVGGEESEIISFAYGLVEISEEIRQCLI